MQFDIKIPPPSNRFWDKLKELGIYPYTSNNGLAYKYVSFETAVRIIESGSLMYTVPSGFNDPFDLTTDLLDTSFTSADITKLVNEQFKASDEEKKHIIDFNIANPDMLKDIFLKVLSEAKSNIGITCFSKSPLKTLMWSHYAEKHAGVCLGFAFDEYAGDGLLHLAVGYADHIRPQNYFQETVFSIYNWIFTKSKVWEYEEELRRVFTNQSGLIPFKKYELRSVFYGVNTAENNIRQLQTLLSKNAYTNVNQQVKMVINPNTFDIAAVDIPRPE